MVLISKTNLDRPLGRIGPEASAAVPRLIELLKDKSAETRRTAVDSLRRISRDMTMMPDFIVALTDEDAHVRGAANRALRCMGSTAVDTLIKTLKAGSASQRCNRSRRHRTPSQGGRCAAYRGAAG